MCNLQINLICTLKIYRPLKLIILVPQQIICGPSSNPKVQRADLMCDVIKKLAPFVFSKL